MLKLLSLRKEQEAKEAASPKTSSALLRITKDHNELSLPPTCKLEFDDPNDLMHFRLILAPVEGIYNGGLFRFTFKVNQTYPHEPPKVHCDTKVYHPNIDLDGNICLNILREDWKPVLDLQSVIYGLVFIFLEPNPADPLNKDAAQEMVDRRADFEMNARRAMMGGTVHGVAFDRCMR